VREAQRQKTLQAQAAAEKKRQAEEAVQQRKAAEAEQKRQAEIKKQQAIASQKAEAEQRRLAEAERQRKIEAEKQETERKRQAEAARIESQKRAAEAELKAKMAAEQQRLEAARAAQRQRELDRYKAQYMADIRNKVQRNWLRPAGIPPGTRCTVVVQQIPGGEVVGVRTLDCTGDIAFQRSVEAAVRKASPLPEPSDKSLFDREIEFSFEVE
jgi:colicin import membrane protein